jgi:hypothetical protein
MNHWETRDVYMVGGPDDGTSVSLPKEFPVVKAVGGEYIIERHFERWIGRWHEMTTRQVREALTWTWRNGFHEWEQKIRQVPFAQKVAAMVGWLIDRGWEVSARRAEYSPQIEITIRARSGEDRFSRRCVVSPDSPERELFHLLADVLEHESQEVKSS